MNVSQAIWGIAGGVMHATFITWLLQYQVCAKINDILIQVRLGSDPELVSSGFCHPPTLNNAQESLSDVSWCLER